MLVAFSSVGLACSCFPSPYRPDVTVEQIRKEKRDYFLNEFKGAAFIGKIIKREHVLVNWIAKMETGEPVDDPEYRYSIRIKEYWFGVESRTLIVYGEPSEPFPGYGTSSCGFKLDIGRTYFFTPRINAQSLEIDECDFAGGGSAPDGNAATEFRHIMGEPKRFAK